MGEMTMVERVARAIAESCSGPWDFLSPEGQEAARHEARAALEAMREPSRAVVDAALHADPDDGGWDQLWKLMIDAALAEEPRPCG